MVTRCTEAYVCTPVHKLYEVDQHELVYWWYLLELQLQQVRMYNIERVGLFLCKTLPAVQEKIRVAKSMYTSQKT